MGGDQKKEREGELKRTIGRAIDRATEAAMAGSDSMQTQQIKSIADVLNAFCTSDAITIRFLPCGRSHPEFSFVGSLLGRDEYIQRERDALFSRHGAKINGWTSVLQIASVSTEAAAGSTRDVDLGHLTLAREGAIDRAALEKASIDMLAMMDSLGVSEGPSWPAVSVVPLGVYRTVPRSIRDLDAPSTPPLAE